MLDAAVDERAYGGELDEPFNHALLSPSARDIVAEGTRSVDQIVHDVHLFNRIIADADGTVTVSKGAALVDSEPADAVTPDADRGDATPAALPLVDPYFQEILTGEDTGVGDELDLVLALNPLDWNPVVSVEHALMVAMIEGRVETRRDAVRVRLEAMQAREAAGGAALEPLLSALDSLGVDVVDTHPLTGSVRVRANAAQLPDLLALDGVAHVDEVRDDALSAGYPTGTEVTGPNITGEEVENLLQTTQFYSAGYYGDSDGFIGLEEGGPTVGGSLVRRNHPGFDDIWGDDRWTNCGSPSGSTCANNPNPDPGNVHATAVASVLLGDLTRGQDPTVPGSGEVARSGVARRAYGLGTGASPSQVVDIMTFAPRDIHLLNHSAGDPDVPCTGTSAYAQSWNSLYESGIGVVMAAGNEGHSTGACTVKDPASAIGVFTVGAYQVDSGDAEYIEATQSRGGGEYSNGSTYVDDGRTLLDVMGPSRHEHSYTDDSSDMDQYPGNICCTSGATPTVTGAAALFRDWYLAVEGTDIDAPGLLYANLLLMGDRMDESGAYLDSGFDELTGAGKLRMRKYDHLDNPSGWGDGSFCLDDGTTHTIEMAPSGLGADVDMIKAVIWWYDHRHDSGSARHDKVKLTLQRYNSSLGLWGIVETSDTDDNKQRVYQAAPSTAPYRLRITGRDVTSDSEGCGPNSTRVYYAFMYEDQDRDSGTSLDDQIRTEE